MVADRLVNAWAQRYAAQAPKSSTSSGRGSGRSTARSRASTPSRGRNTSSYASGARAGGSGGRITPTALISHQPSSSPAPAPTGSGSTGGGGGGGGGTPGRVAPATPAPTPELDVEEITAALDAISAMFNFQKGELTTEQEAALRGFDFLKTRLLQNRERAEEATTDQAAGRGLLRSGLYLREVGRLGSETASNIAQARAEKNAKVQAISRAVGNLEAQEEAERVAQARSLAREQVGTKEAIAQALKLA